MSNHPDNNNTEDFLPSTTSQQQPQTDEDEFHPDWLAIGETTLIEPVTPFETEILIVATIENDEEVGIVSLTLDPMELREMHTQLENIIINQNYLMTGNTPAEVVQQNTTTSEVSTFEKLIDPIGIAPLVDKLSAESPIKGLSWKALLFIFFALLTITLMAIRGVTG